MTDEERAALQKAIEYCAICPNMCRFDCPVARAERSESSTPAGRVRLALMLAQDMLARTPDLTRHFYRCADCRGCETWCPFPEVKVADIMVAARTEGLTGGTAPGEIVSLLDGLRQHGHPFARQVPRRLTDDDLPKSPTLSGAVLFLPGCTASALRPATSRAIAAVLGSAGVDWFTLPEHLCCGAPARAAGDLPLEAELAARLTSAINDSQATIVVTACPGCAETLSLRCGELGLTVRPRVLHFAEFARELIASGRLQLRPTDIGAVVYHDPCTMTRRLDIVAAPRAVIGAIPGLELLTARHRARETHCCGAGGMLGEVWPEAAAAITRERLAELVPGADAIVTTCPMCEHVFTAAQADAARPTPVLDLAELLQRALMGGESGA